MALSKSQFGVRHINSEEPLSELVEAVVAMERTQDIPKLSESKSWPSTPGSIEKSFPPTPSLGPPVNFGQVCPGVYRSSFPLDTNLEHLDQLDLRTILTLVPEDYPKANVNFMKKRNIAHYQVHIPAHKGPLDCIPLEAMTKALSVLCNQKNHPILVHCNKGKHRTGCVIGCYRKMDGWGMEKILAEYRRYAGAKARAFDENYLHAFDHDAMGTKLNDMFLEMAKQAMGLPTPPSSDREAKDKDEMQPSGIAEIPAQSGFPSHGFAFACSVKKG